MSSITAATLLISAGSAVGAWFSTSSPKLSYFGSQTCLAFYLTTLQSYTIPTGLSAARDAFVGVLVGLIAMWVIFEHLWPLRAAEGMLRGFASNLRLLAELMTVFEHEVPERIVQKVRSLRELINSGFAAVHAHADSMVFEFGPQRRNNLALRDRILRWQASARTLFLVQVAILQYRIQIDYTTVPEHVKAAQAEFDAALQRVLNGIAANVDDVSSEPETLSLTPTLKAFTDAVTSWYQSRGIDPPPRTQGILALSHQLHDLVTQLSEDVLGSDADETAPEPTH
jgi:multidrug resistance protein MdtO